MLASSARFCTRLHQASPTRSHKHASLHDFIAVQAKAKIMVIRDIEREDIDFISKTLHCMPISHVDHMRPEKLGHASMVEEKQASPLALLCYVWEAPLGLTVGNPSVLF